MGNKHLVRKYRMKRKDADSLEKEGRKSTSSDQEDVDAPSRRKTGTLLNLSHHHQQHRHQHARKRKATTRGSAYNSPCRLVTMLVV
uniref:Uncharacterized protein n=1 Tax=Mesocestoides corti TaxID=53468 RepID=A0A5K3G5F1_MESCO